jgi:hypothetical protein
MVDIGTARARTCVGSYEEPRSAELPDCRKDIRWFVTPSRIFWTETPASYRAEELQARIAIAAYTDALVGYPDREAAKRAAEGIETWAKVLARGSRRLALEELGRTVGAPDLGRQAALGGDRETLLARFDHWDDWNVRLRALEAALTEGDLARATSIAKRYADFDPRDEELRTAVAATLCLDADPARGIAMLTTIQEERATQRHESWARDWGEVRAALVACAARAGLVPPPKPSPADGGLGDAEEARAVLRLRLLTRPDRRPGLREENAARDAALAAVSLLESPRTPRGRATLLAALLSVKYDLPPKELAQMAAPSKDSDEAPILSSPAALTALDWLPYRRTLTPVVDPPALKQAVSTLKSLARSERLTPEESGALLSAAGAVAIEAARAFASAGDAKGAMDALEDAGPRALPTAVARALARSSACYLAGDPARALRELDEVGAELGAPVDEPNPAPGSAPAHVLEVRAAALIQRAEILASLGRRDEALASAIIAEAAARAAGHHGLSVRARWTRLALARRSEGAKPPTPRAPGDRSWPWVGAAGTSASWLSPEAEGPASFERALGFFRDARGASPEERRALRYAAFAHRGDLPNAPVAYLAVVAELLRPGEGDVELWLDAFSAIDAHRLPLCTYAFLRAEAARFRGDSATAAIWAERYRTLAAITSDPSRAEIARVLGL